MEKIKNKYHLEFLKELENMPDREPNIKKSGIKVT